MAEKKILSIPEKLAKITELVDVLRKDTAAYNFSYVNEEAILEKLTVGLKQQKLELYPMIVPNTLKTAEQLYDKKKVNKQGQPIVETIHETVVSADMVMRWINLENINETLDIPWILVGQQADASQSFGSALSYCTRYFYLKFFHVATTKDDPDNFRSKQAEVEDKQTKTAITAVIESITETIGKYVNKEKEKATKIKGFLMDNNNNEADYTKIKDIEIANALKTKIEEFVNEQKEVK